MYPLPRGSSRYTSCHLNNREYFEKGVDPERMLTADLHAALLQFAAPLLTHSTAVLMWCLDTCRLRRGMMRHGHGAWTCCRLTWTSSWAKSVFLLPRFPISMSILSPRNRSEFKLYVSPECFSQGAQFPLVLSESRPHCCSSPVKWRRAHHLLHMSGTVIH